MENGEGLEKAPDTIWAHLHWLQDDCNVNKILYGGRACKPELGRPSSVTMISTMPMTMTAAMVMGVAVGAVMALMTTLALLAAERIAEAALELEWGRGVFRPLPEAAIKAALAVRILSQITCYVSV